MLGAAGAVHVRALVKLLLAMLCSDGGSASRLVGFA